MFRSTSLGFNKYELSEENIVTSRKWQGDEMYKTSYFRMSEKNVTLNKHFNLTTASSFM